MSLSTLLQTAVKTSLDAGDAILDIYDSDFSVSYKDDRSPLTQADKASHNIIVEALAPFGIPVLSEEGAKIPYEERKKWDEFWMIDPLDGTKEFIGRNGEFTVNIALIRGNRPVAGIVYVPVSRRLYIGWGGEKAYRVNFNDRIEAFERTKTGRLSLTDMIEIGVSLPETTHLPAYTIVGSRSHGTPELQKYVEQKRSQKGEVQFLPAGSSLKFCLVAEGKADEYPRLGPTMEWDTAAGQAVAENAGAHVFIHETGTPLVYNKEILTNPWFVVSREGRSGQM